MAAEASPLQKRGYVGIAGSNPVSGILMDDIIARQIPLKKIVKNRWYLGRGRNQNIGFFNGKFFYTWCYKFEVITEKLEGHYSKKPGCFQPFILIPTLEEIMRSSPQQINKAELEDGAAYIGKGKNNYVAFWDQDKFVTIGDGKTSIAKLWGKKGPKLTGKIFDGLVALTEKYGKEFKPYKKVPCGAMIEPFGESAWDAHYGRKLRVAHPNSW